MKLLKGHNRGPDPAAYKRKLSIQELPYKEPDKFLIRQMSICTYSSRNREDRRREEVMK